MASKKWPNMTPEQAYQYALLVMGKRWPAAEPTIRRSKTAWKAYQRDVLGTGISGTPRKRSGRKSGKRRSGRRK